MKSQKRRGKNKSYNRRDSNRNMQRDAETTPQERSGNAKYDAMSKPNDPAWYARSPQILKDFASLPFGNPLGSRLPTDVAALGASSISGIMTLFYTPTIGVATSENSAVNVAMRNIYSYVRHANSGHSNYEAPDLMIYLLAMDSVYMFHAWLKRLYGQIMLTTVYNRYYPKALIESELVDFDDLQANIADFRGYINLFAGKVGAMCVPNSMSYMARHTWMTEGIYVDDPSTPKAQTYKYVPASFLQFQLNEIEGGVVGGLGQVGSVFQGAHLINTPRKFADIVQLGNSLINPILANEDMNIMSGDILKAFTDSGVVKLTGITENYVVLPAYSPEVLSQMENSSIYWGGLGMAVSQTVEVGTGWLVSTPIAPVQSMETINYWGSASDSTVVTAAMTQQMIEPYIGTRLLNMHHQDVSPEEVMVATRLMNTVADDTTLEGTTIGGEVYARAYVKSCGSEIICGATMWHYVYDNSGLATLSNTPFATAYMVAAAPDSTNCVGLKRSWVSVLPVLAQVMQFAWHPMIYPTLVEFTAGGDATVKSVVSSNCMFGDISNYTTISEDNIANMHDIALLSEFSVPQAGLFQ